MDGHRLLGLPNAQGEMSQRGDKCTVSSVTGTWKTGEGAGPVKG